MKRTNQRFIYLCLALLMAGLGVSDALRGIFAPEFQRYFGLNASGISLMVTVSYGGNLIFLFAGTRIADHFPKGRVFGAALALWAAALLLYVATDSFPLLLVGMFAAMGASTLLNTLVSLMAPLLFAAPGLAVNTLFFAQGIGTSVGQGLIGRFMSDFDGWKQINSLLLAIGLVSLFLIRRWNRRFLEREGQEITLKEKEKEQSIGTKRGILRPAFWKLVFIFGFYFIAEHGILNWLALYCLEGLSLPLSKGTLYLSLFFGGMTAGRLALAPAVQRLGTLRSVRLFGAAGTALYVSGLAVGTEWGLVLLASSGLMLSVVYPTLVLSVQEFFEDRNRAAATGAVISAATLFDIGFNLSFGSIISWTGYRLGFLFLPASAVCFCGLAWAFMRKGIQQAARPSEDRELSAQY